MRPTSYKFSSAITSVYFDHRFRELGRIVPKQETVLITDENVFKKHKPKFRGWNVIVLKAGEEYKVQATVDALVAQLIAMRAGRDSILVGVGGGVITDITGYTASIFMRGIRFGFVPTTLLGMVDASIGGKNGVDVDEYKNMVGLIRQPAFILYDHSFLETLPVDEWKNGFAEIIKHACISNPGMFARLEKGSIHYFQQNKKSLAALIRTNAVFKLRLVKRDEFEKNERRLLNFGHTLGHALENQYELSHGQAIAIGMGAACRFSEKLAGFKDSERVISLIEKYGLPPGAAFNKEKMFRVMSMDKKRVRRNVNFILLQKTGRAVTRSISLSRLKKLIDTLI